jgi:hypothetical protein
VGRRRSCCEEEEKALFLKLGEPGNPDLVNKAQEAIVLTVRYRPWSILKRKTFDMGTADDSFPTVGEVKSSGNFWEC